MPPLHGSFKVSELVDVYSYIFLLFFFKFFCFYPSTLDCLIIEICDSIYSAFKHGCSSITTRSKILHLNLSGLISSFFYTFFNFNFSWFSFCNILFAKGWVSAFSFYFIWSYHILIWFIWNWSLNFFSCFFFSMRLSQSYVHGHRICELTWFN
jgi:hypothetical protein